MVLLHLLTALHFGKTSFVQKVLNEQFLDIHLFYLIRNPLITNYQRLLKLKFLFRINLNFFSSQYAFVGNLQFYILRYLICNFKNVDLHCRTLNQYFAFACRVQRFAIALLFVFFPRRDISRISRNSVQKIFYILQFSELSPKMKFFLVFCFFEQVTAKGNSPETS